MRGLGVGPASRRPQKSVVTKGAIQSGSEESGLKGYGPRPETNVKDEGDGGMPWSQHPEFDPLAVARVVSPQGDTCLGMPRRWLGGPPAALLSPAQLAGLRT